MTPFHPNLRQALLRDAAHKLTHTELVRYEGRIMQLNSACCNLDSIRHARNEAVNTILTDCAPAVVVAKFTRLLAKFKTTEKACKELSSDESGLIIDAFKEKSDELCIEIFSKLRSLEVTIPEKMNAGSYDAGELLVWLKELEETLECHRDEIVKKNDDFKKRRMQNYVSHHANWVRKQERAMKIDYLETNLVKAAANSFRLLWRASGNIFMTLAPFAKGKKQNSKFV